VLKLVGALAVATMTLYGLTHFIGNRYDSNVAARFLERPPTYLQYTRTSLARWVSAHPDDAAAYVFPVLFPLDMLFMICLAASLSIASVALITSIPPLLGVSWVALIAPALYLGADLAEDTLLAILLGQPHTVSNALVTAAQTLTRVKIWAVTLAGIQLIALGVAALLARQLTR